jgi:subtilase family serine protease
MTLRPHHYIKRPHADVAPAPWKIADLCAAYQWPTKAPGGGVIAIVELGGGFVASDLEQFSLANGDLPIPVVVEVSVDGTTNTPGGDADGEVALDIEVAWASYYAATGHAPQIRIYWCADIATGVRAAVKDNCDVCSISWGADEAQWPAGNGPGSALDMEAAAQAALAAGMVVFAAAGDNDSSDGGPNAVNVDCPSSCPSVVACGGTSKTTATETVWNNEPGQSNGSGTGGGYSQRFAMPVWQLTGAAPESPGLTRMVPDVAANADPNTGYEIFFQGSAQVVGGTSAVAPLYAGLVAAFGKKPAASYGPARLWANPGAFADVVSGDNGQFKAQVGPDPCTGLGVPVGVALAAL